MKLFFSFLIFLGILTACKNQGEASPYDNILQEPPFSEITDSINKQPSDILYYRRGLKLKQAGFTEPALADFNKAWSLNKREEYAVNISSVLLDKNPDSAQLFL